MANQFANEKQTVTKVEELNWVINWVANGGGGIK